MWPCWSGAPRRGDRSMRFICGFAPATITHNWCTGYVRCVHIQWFAIQYYQMTTIIMVHRSTSKVAIIYNIRNKFRTLKKFN